ncbi:MAG: MAE_28990/MAE_18760 family HEPN-like nuclease [Flavobacterium sp.]
MSILRDDFDVRVQEINIYFTFLQKLENDVNILSNHDQTQILRLNDEHLKIFKANGFLLLYNLIESTVLNSVISVFDEIKFRGLGYKDVIDDLKKYWFKHRYKHDDSINKETIYKKFHLLVEEIISNVAMETIQKLEYGGSIDNQRMKEIAKSMGIDFSYPDYRKNTHGEALVEIKKRRNNLAHGEISFASLGKDYSYYGSVRIEEDTSETILKLGLKHYQQFTIEHLTKYIECIENFIDSESFRLVT